MRPDERDAALLWDKDDQLWATATIHVPALIARLEPLIPPLPSDSK